MPDDVMRALEGGEATISQTIASTVYATSYGNRNAGAAGAAGDGSGNGTANSHNATAAPLRRGTIAAQGTVAQHQAPQRTASQRAASLNSTAQHTTPQRHVVEPPLFPSDAPNTADQAELINRAARQLLDASKRLEQVTERYEDAAAWLNLLNDWHTRYADIIIQRTTARDDPSNPKATRQEWWWTHGDVRRCYRRMERLFREGRLFTFCDPALLGKGPVERNTNRLEDGVNSLIKRTLARHHGLTEEHMRRGHIGTKVIAYNPRRRCGRKRVGVSNLVPVSSWSDEDTIEQGPGVWIVRGEDEEERP